MNKWIIFIIIVGVVTAIGAVISVIDIRSSSRGNGIAGDAKAVPQKPDPTVRIVNSSEYPISPGLIVLHDRSFSMNFLGMQAPKAYELLAEVGDPSEIINSVRGNADVYEIFEVGMIEPGAMQNIILPDRERYGSSANDMVLSYMAMIVTTNDGVVWLNSEPLYTSSKEVQVGTEIIDMGTEKNEPIGSGFAGGQPDPTRGDENIINGTATDEPAHHHPQFYEDDAVSDDVVWIYLKV